MSQTQIGFDEAVREIKSGNALPRCLWVSCPNETHRDGYALKPSPWEGPGVYQHVQFGAEVGRLVRLPENGPRLTDIAAQVSA